MVRRKSKGFTLIELLVVISIISFLSSIVFASVGSSQNRARDAKRIQNIKAVQIALELYHSTNKVYPATGGFSTMPPFIPGGSPNNSAWNGPATGNCSSLLPGGTYTTNWIPGLTPTYIPSLPVDTIGCYLYVSNGKDYMLLSYRSVEGTVPYGLRRPRNPSEASFAVYSAGAANW